MEFIIDLLSENEATRKRSAKVLKSQQARKAGKHERIKKMLKNIADTQTQPVIDMLATTFGD